MPISVSDAPRDPNIARRSAVLVPSGGRVAQPWAGDGFEASRGAPVKGALVAGARGASGDVTMTLRLPPDYDGPILLCDIDGTLRDTSVVDVALGKTQPPIPGAAEMLEGLAKRGVPIIYLSAGPDLIHSRNDAFLAQLPPGILLDKPHLSPMDVLLGARGRAEMNGEFKDEVIGKLRQAFPNAQLVGLGDDAQGDAIAYTSDHVDAFIHDIRPQHDTIPADFHGTLSTTYDDAYRAKLFADVDAMIARSRSFSARAPIPDADAGDDVGAASELSAVLDQVTGTTASTVTEPDVLVDGDAAFPALLRDLDEAHESILYQTFNFFDDPVGDEVVAKLIAAKERGVLVRVVVDAFGAREFLGKHNAALDRLRAAGIEVHDYNPLDSANDLLDIHREHRKCVVIDGKTAWVGGMNTAQAFMGDKDVPLRKHDVMLRFGGAAVKDVVAAFLDSWREAGGAAFDPATLGDQTARDDDDDGDVKARLLVHAQNDQRIRAAYLAMIDGAQSHIDIENSFPMEDDVVDALVAAAGRGVKVRYIVGSNEGALGEDAKERFAKLIAAGVDIYQYPTPVHTKALGVDGVMVSVGSSNVDTMSLSQDREIVLLVEDAAFARKFADAVFDADVAVARKLTATDVKGFWGRVGRSLLSFVWPKKDE